MKDLLMKLSAAFGPAGSEEDVRAIAQAELAKIAEGMHIDTMGNLLAQVGPKGRATKAGRTVLVTAHLDEVGLVITNVDNNGYLRFGALGRFDPHLAFGQRVRFANGTTGVIGAEPLEEIQNLRADKLYIDIGASSEAEARKLVNPGDAAAYDRQPALLGTRLTGNAAGSRAAVAVLLQALKELKSTPHEVHVAFTTQKEVGSRGVRPAAFGVDADLAIVLDATATGDTPEAKRMEVSLGKGVAVKVKDQSGIAHPAVRRALTAAAEKAGKPVQFEVLEGAGSELGVVQMSKGGVPTSGLAIPTRYRFSPTEVVDLGDLQAAVAVLVQFLKEPIPLTF
ncbi:MAG: M42 family metallopeptidase [Symbiobacteriia bacterium]